MTAKRLNSLGNWVALELGPEGSELITTMTLDANKSLDLTSVAHGEVTLQSGTVRILTLLVPTPAWPVGTKYRRSLVFIIPPNVTPAVPQITNLATPDPALVFPSGGAGGKVVAIALYFTNSTTGWVIL